MEKMNDLRGLLKHELQDLYSAEEQIIDALPAMINKANDSQLKQALEQHLQVTRQQRDRLDRVRQILGDTRDQSNNSGFFADLFGTGNKCKGMEGLIDEGQKIVSEDMSPEVRDAAIIASAQKIEHYEICGYGTARTYAQQLGLNEAAQLLQQTLDEEHEADDKLTSLAIRDVNQRAETGPGMNRTGTGTYR